MSAVPFGAAASSVICQQLYLPACQHGNTRRRGGVSLRARGAGPCFSSSSSIHHGADRRRPTRFDASAPGDLHPSRRRRALIDTTASPSPVARMLHHPQICLALKWRLTGRGFARGMTTSSITSMPGKTFAIQAESGSKGREAAFGFGSPACDQSQPPRR